MCSNMAALLAVVVVSTNCSGPSRVYGAVIEHHAVLAQHDAVAGAADRKRRDSVGVEEIEEAAGIGALDIDLAERRHVA